MTNKITKEFLFTELSIKIATLEMKLDAILKLLNKPEITIKPLEIMSLENVLSHNKNAADLFKDLVPVGTEVDCSGVNAMGKLQDFPLQWPNESYTDYLKRIGQYNEASSDDENFSEEFK